VAFGGTDDPTNLVPACRACNARRGVATQGIIARLKRGRSTAKRQRNQRSFSV